MEIFSLDIWVTSINIENIIKTNLDSIVRAKKTYDFNTMKAESVKELREQYRGYYTIYTDGSKSGNGGGAAYYDPRQSSAVNKNNCFKIDQYVSVMSLELCAISEALSYLQNIATRKALICVDSKSALLKVLVALLAPEVHR